MSLHRSLRIRLLKTEGIVRRPEEALNVLTEDVKRNVPVRYCIFSATKKLIYLNVHFLAPKVFISRLDPYLNQDPNRCILSIRNWYPRLRNKPVPPTPFLDFQLPLSIRFYLYTGTYFLFVSESTCYLRITWIWIRISSASKKSLKRNVNVPSTHDE